MNSKSLTEVYDIVNLMSDEYQNLIPYRFKEYIKANRDPLYKTGIVDFPESVDGLQEETKALLGIIYEKYILNTKYDISDTTKEEIINKYQEEVHKSEEDNKNIQIELVESKDDDSLIAKFKKVIKKLVNYFKK